MLTIRLWRGMVCSVSTDPNEWTVGLFRAGDLGGAIGSLLEGEWLLVVGPFAIGRFEQ